MLSRHDQNNGLSASLAEIRQRLIHIELKVDAMAGAARTAEAGSEDHPDQPFGGRSFAQFGEDLVILNLFHRIGIERPSYLDIGAHHPLNLSNTALLHRRGSRGINVEANPHLIGAFRSARPEDETLNLGVGPVAGELTFYMIDDFSGRNTFDRATAEAFVIANPQFRIRGQRKIPVVTIDQLVASHACGKYPDFLSLDVEGWDRSILESADFSKSRPVAICVEAVSGDGTDQTAALVDLMEARAYFLHYETLGNLLFVDAAFRAALHGRPGKVTSP